MYQELKELIKNSHAPYSNYKVSAIVVTKDLNKFKGVNVEISSLGGTICAERNAINAAIANGYQKGDFKELHLLCDTKSIGYPCMICRQTFIDFFDSNTKIYIYNITGMKEELNLESLCPYPFDEGEIL